MTLVEPESRHIKFRGRWDLRTLHFVPGGTVADIIHAHTHTFILTDICTYTHISICIYMCIYIHSYIYIVTRMYNYTYIYRA